jgi:hypothetical protein
MSDAAKLAPCPFCNKPLYIKRGHINPSAYCRTDDCFGRRMPCVNLDDAENVAAWNTRASLPREAELRRALEAAEADIIATAKAIGSRYNRKTKSYEFNDELFAAISPGSFAVVQQIRAALSSEGQEKKSQEGGIDDGVYTGDPRLARSMTPAEIGASEYRWPGDNKTQSERLALHEGDCKSIGSPNCDEAFEAYRVKAIGRHNAYPIDVYVAFCAGFNVAASHIPPETVKAHPFKASLGTALCTECSGTESAPWHRPPDKAQDLAQALILTRVELEKARERIVTMRAAIQAAMASSWESPCEPYHCVSNAAYQQMRNSIAAPDTEGR